MLFPAAAASLPSPVRRQFSSYFVNNSAIHLFPVSLDVKQTEALRCLFVDSDLVGLASELRPKAIPVFLSSNASTEQLFCTLRPNVSVFLDLHDSGHDSIDLSRPIWDTTASFGLKVIYVKLQVHSHKKYTGLNLLPHAVHVLSCPLLLGGSRFHITNQKDLIGDALFRTVFLSNIIPNYNFDWSWIGAETGSDRKGIFNLLDSYQKRKFKYAITRSGHVDANKASIPYLEYIAASRQSKICISLNGHGPWCLKDGELLANNCFILRQWHSSLEINPLTPKDQIHWAVFKDSEVVNACEYYLNNDAEREMIRLRGHQLFNDVLFNGFWAKHYAHRLSRFLSTQSKVAWDDLAIA